MRGMEYELGKRLRRLREARGLSRQLLHERADVSTTYISQIELGEDPRTKAPPQPSPETLRKLARGLEPADEEGAERCYEELMAAAGYLPAAEREAGGAPAVAPASQVAEPLFAAAAACDFVAPALACAASATAEAEVFALRLPDRRLRRHLPAVLAAWPEMTEDERTTLVTVLRWLDEKYAPRGQKDAASGGRRESLVQP